MKQEKTRSPFTEAMLEFAAKLEEDTVFCSHCGRVLTDPDSIKRGIGPICQTEVEEGGE